MPSQRQESSNDLARLVYERHAEVCKVFSNPIRLMILNVLRDGEMTVAALAQTLGIPLGTVSPHLLMMKGQRVLLSRKRGNQVFYSLANPKMLQAFDLIREMLYEQMNQEGILTRHLGKERAKTMKRLQRRPVTS